MKLIKLGLKVGVVVGVAKVVSTWIEAVHLHIINSANDRLDKLVEAKNARKKDESAVESESK